mmetsp:Transcript_1597/g.2548  ORF Transcript_1597/g.2548 Transcript_1597/m.2548 type:complete len:153 (+) Transcript_1597:96-554(+)
MSRGSTLDPSTISDDMATALLKFEKLNQRARVMFVYQTNDFGHGCLMITAGNETAKSLFGIDSFVNMTIKNISGPGTCDETMKKIYMSLDTGMPCEHFLNLYTTKGVPVSCFVSFRVNSVKRSQSFYSVVTSGVINIALASIVGNTRFLARC